jgi:uncharacterized protein YxjI
MAMMLYTYLRRRKTVNLGTAANAAPPSYSEKDRSSSWPLELTGKTDSHAKTEPNAALCESIESVAKDLLNSPVAIFPQYVALETTKLVMKEDMIPYLPGSFTVWQNNKRVFEIDRERPSLTHRTNIVDAESQQMVLSVRKNLCNVPVSFTFEDAGSKKIVDLQGDFFIPYSGAKSTAHLVNAETAMRTTLTMKGSYMNRHAVIKNEEGEVVVRMLSNVFEGRNLVGHRRTYELTVQAGFDISLAVAMIVALHEREQQ